MDKALTAIYRTPEGAALAADFLMEAGFTEREFCLLAANVPDAAHFAAVPRRLTMVGLGTGALMGIFLGAFFGVLVALDMGQSVEMPAVVRPFLESPIVAGLSGAGAGAVVGSMLGALIGRFQVRNEAVVRNGHGPEFTLVGVAAPKTMARTAREILNTAGASRVTRDPL